MKIAILTELYPPSVGGQEQFFAGIAAELARRGHSVEVYCVAHQKGLPSLETGAGITISRYPVSPTYKSPTLRWTKRSLRAMVRYALFTRRIARERRHDIYFLNEWPLLHVPFLPRDARRRTVLHWCELRTGRLFSFLQTALPRLAARNAAISSSVAAHIGQAVPDDVVVLPSGLDLGRYQRRPQSERNNILSIGRLVAHKNHTLLLRSFEHLRDGGYAGRLVIAGSGPLEDTVRADAAASRYAANIDVLGNISEEHKIALLASSELLAMTSEREGFPRVVAEAMASGLPTVTTNFEQNGTKEVVAEHGNGVVTGTSPELFAQGMREALENWPALSDAGLSAASELDWSTIAEDFERLAAQILAEFEPASKHYAAAPQAAE